MKLNKRKLSAHHSYLSEVTRKNLVGKTKVQSPARYKRSMKYTSSDYSIDVGHLLETDELVTQSKVGDYEVIVAFQGVLDELKDVLKSQPKPNVNLQTVIKTLNRSIDAGDIKVDCECPDFCLEENTKIKLLNGNIVTVKELLNKFNNQEELWVYSTDENGDFKPGRVTDVWISGYVSKMIKVTLDNGEYIITTPNHRYMMRDTSYKNAENLKIGDSLMPLYFSYSNGYENIKLNTKARSFVSVYKIVANELLKDQIEEAKLRSNENNIAIHHSDFNKLNNYPSNLKPLGVHEHWIYHANLATSDSERFKKFTESGRKYWRTPEGRAQKSEEMSKSIKSFWNNMSEDEKAEYIKESHEWMHTEEGHEKLSSSLKEYWNNLDDETRKMRTKDNGKILNGENGELSSIRKKNWWKNATLEQREHCKQAYLEAIKDKPIITTEKKRIACANNFRKVATANHIKSAEEVINRMIENNVVINEENYNLFRNKGESSFNTAKKYGLIERYNHKVSSIEYIEYDTPIPVYDLTVDKYNNFFVNSGIVLHNCYRFAYWATEYDYKYGKPETRPSKITNPGDKLGSACKHIIKLTKDKRWLVKLSSVLNDAIKKYLDEFREAMGLSEDEMFINIGGRPSDKTGRNTKMLKKQDKSKVIDDDPKEDDIDPEESEDDLIVKDPDENEEDTKDTADESGEDEESEEEK